MSKQEQNKPQSDLAERADAENELAEWITLTSESGYRMTIDFGPKEWESLVLDEPPPLGSGTGPSPDQILAAAVAGCLVASLRYCLEKARIDVERVSARVRPSVARNEKGRLRIASISAVIEASLGEASSGRAQRCVELFQDFCTVTESVRHGIPVDVRVELA
jgi:uncharacterized OsmC-like protein